MATVPNEGGAGDAVFSDCGLEVAGGEWAEANGVGAADSLFETLVDGSGTLGAGLAADPKGNPPNGLGVADSAESLVDDSVTLGAGEEADPKANPPNGLGAANSLFEPLIDGSGPFGAGLAAEPKAKPPNGLGAPGSLFEPLTDGSETFGAGLAADPKANPPNCLFVVGSSAFLSVVVVGCDPKENPPKAGAALGSSFFSFCAPFAVGATGTDCDPKPNEGGLPGAAVGFESAPDDGIPNPPNDWVGFEGAVVPV